MGTLYLTQQYNGPVYWYRIPAKVPEDKVQDIIRVFSERYGSIFVGVYYDPRFIILYFKPVQSYQWQIIIPVILSMAVGALGYAYFTSKPSSGYSGSLLTSNGTPVGIPLSFTDLLKIGLIVIIAGIGAYIGVNTYVAYKKGEYLEPERVVPLQYLRENVGQPLAKAGKYVVEQAGKGVKYLVENVR